MSERTNTFRKQYRELTQDEKDAVEAVKSNAENLESIFALQKGMGKDARSLALAMTKLEESVMWAVKAITG